MGKRQIRAIVNFRPTPTVKAFINDKLAEDKDAKITEIINEVLEQVINPKIPKVDGIPPKNYCPRDRKFYLLETIFTICKECDERKSCPAWVVFGRTTMH